MTPLPIAALSAMETTATVSIAPSPPRSNAFGRMLMDGIQAVDTKIQTADATVQAFAIDDSIPVHQVTLALEQARLSFELMMQVRTRLLDAYQDFSRMQL